MIIEAFHRGNQARMKRSFPIRGHHLEWFFEAEKEKKEGRTNHTNASAECSIPATVNTLVTNIENCGDPDYIRDTLGETPALKKQVMKAYTDIFTLFYSLPEDYPVHVGSQPDLICSSCPIGQHCKRQPLYGDDKYTRRLSTLMTFQRRLTGEPECSISPSETAHGVILETTVRRLRDIFTFMSENNWKLF